MRIGRTKSVVVQGLAGTVIDIEGYVRSGLPRVEFSGLPDTATVQAPGRIRAAMLSSELEFPDSHLMLNLSPASVQKTAGAALDLPLAVAILAMMGVVGSAETGWCVHLGELGMDGSVRAVEGVLPAVMAAAERGYRTVVVPKANAHEAALVSGVKVHPVATLSDVIALHRGLARGEIIELPWPEEHVPTAPDDLPDLVDVAGQAEARFALEVAAAGGHNVSFVGPPGSGKTMLASRLPGILPALTRQDALTVTSVHSILGTLGDRPLIETPPFVAPHHGATMPAMIGGGSGKPKPGAVSQAHAGVLFLDEAPEFRREVLDALRQPLESGVVTVARADQMIQYPCRFQLVLARNPCPCGRYVGNGAACTCSVKARSTYSKRLSEPLMDRVDVHLAVPAITRADLAQGPGEASSVVVGRVIEARERSARRWAEFGIMTNSRVPGSILRSSAWALPSSVLEPLNRAMDLGDLSLRGYDRSLRIAWTLADLRGAAAPNRDDVFQATYLRDSEAAA